MITRIKQIVLISGLCASQVYATTEAPMEIQIEAKSHAKTKVVVAVLDYQSDELQQIAEVIQKDLSFSGQFAVDVEKVGQLRTKNEVRKFFERGYPLAILLSRFSDDDQVVEWRLYDTSQVAMAKGKRYKKRGKMVRGWAHNIADSIWPELTGQEGFFSTKIAYGKQVTLDKKKRPVRHIYVADYDGSNAQPLVTTPTINVAPRWNRDINRPLIFYSEGTNANIRLMSATMQGQRKIASNFDGINMLPSFAHDGKKVVYSASRGSAQCQIYLYEKGKLKQLTDNPGNNLSATMTADGKALYFCSDFPSGRPHIYRYDLEKQMREQITFGSQEFCPVYCAKSRNVAYTKRVNGVPQIFVYNEASKEHKQLTFDREYKDECSWSPCGNYLLFSVEKGMKSRLEILNLLTGERRAITPGSEHCNYPNWSPFYTEFPVIQA